MANFIDLEKSIASVFEKEEPIAFFDFKLIDEGKDTLTGLCKIARPKEGVSTLNYLSLMLICDIVNNHSTERLKEVLSRLTKEALERHFAGIGFTLSVPSVSPDPSLSISQVEIVFDESRPLDSNFCVQKLYPAVCECTDIEAGELVLWSDMPNSCPREEESVESFFDLVRRFSRG